MIEAEAVDGFSCRQEDEVIGSVIRRKSWKAGVRWELCGIMYSRTVVRSGDVDLRKSTTSGGPIGL